MKKISFGSLLTLLIFYSNQVSSQTFNWAKQGTVISQFNRSSRGTGIVSDLSGNCITIGNFMDTLVQENDTLECNGFNIGIEGTFISKRDVNGSLIWTKKITSTQNGAQGICIAIDDSGNVYAGGIFVKTFYVDNLSISTPALSPNGESSFIIKINSNGVVQWAQYAQYFIINDININPNRDVFVCGYFGNPTSFGLTTLTSMGLEDIALAKCNNNGQWAWAVKAGSSSYDRGYSVGLDSYNHVYLSGTVTANAFFGTHNLTINDSSVFFLAKYDTSGNNLWIKSIISGYTSIGENMTTDPHGNCYLSGTFLETISYSTGSFVSGSHLFDIYVMKFDSSANTIWAKQIGENYQDVPGDICLDLLGNVYVTGTIRGNVTFDSINVTPVFYDVFIAKYNNSGAIQYVRDIGGANGYADYCFGICADVFNNILITGEFESTIHFGTINLTTANDHAYYVAKLQSPITSIPVMTKWGLICFVILIISVLYYGIKLK